ncbi:hypothetical protein SAMN02745164_01728 [Marinitoga hydrogenitolerans DSM 16785]|uniref:Uncharacterized protein n=1 Tax=Marinitoga hydrogenitolerans (strain DSM 16785 / JCM 12826 / AT1271) TaxID=1122195 RepID=A0A1M4YNK6_MARH1|nr:hypothetical protein [Marinitoga hydrogenitolerans]SHF07395.1 hypothetical protein SAMN02745164_01728 [Marinitoga hydrogenitolerans DSM 16785]
MRKLWIILLLLLSISIFGRITINFRFLFTFGSTNTTYSQYVKIHYIEDSSVSTISFNFNTYPQDIIIDNEEFTVFSKTQKFITGSGRIIIKYNNRKYEFLLQNEELEISLDKEIKPNIKIISYTKEVSPNDDWYNDSMKIVLYSNTFGIVKLYDYEKLIHPGKNEIYFPIDLNDGNYQTTLFIYNKKGLYKKDIAFEVNRNKKTATKYIVLSILGLFSGFIVYTIINNK